MAFKFEKLIVWQKVLDLSEEVDTLTKKFPKEELYILSSQIKRAADSVSLKLQKALQARATPNLAGFYPMHCVQISK